jgi:hypothetical protein
MTSTYRRQTHAHDRNNGNDDGRGDAHRVSAALVRGKPHHERRPTGAIYEVIRQMIVHEDDVTNHRIMWLLVVQGLLVNAVVSAKQEDMPTGLMLSLVGILVVLSTFVMLSKSYQARGYLHFLGQEAKRGQLLEAYLPLDGWPQKRIKGWGRDVWGCPWLGQAGDVLEPWLFLPSLLLIMWLGVVRQRWSLLDSGPSLGLAVILDVVILSGLCIVWVWSQGKGETERPEEPAQASRTDGDRNHVG